MPAARPRKKRRVFLWVFLAIQVIFILWLIAGAAMPAPSSAGQVAAQCGGHNWFPLFKSHADCVTHFGAAMRGATSLGQGLGMAFIVLAWVVVDFFLGMGYGVYKLATR